MRHIALDAPRNFQELTDMREPRHDAEVQSIIGRHSENGGPFWARPDGNIHTPAGFSTIDVLNVLGELDPTARRYPLIADAIEFVLGYQTPEGAFRHSPTSCTFPCMTGQILAGLGRLRVVDDGRCEAAFSWLLNHQADDGGWRCATVRPGGPPGACASNPGATLYILDAFRYRRRRLRGERDRLDHAVESLLRHWNTRFPLGPCVFGIGSRFLRVEYPFLRYNLFYYVYVLSYYPAARGDPRFGQAVSELAAHTRADQMVIEAPYRKWRGYEFANPGRPSTCATARWREIRANLTLA